MTYTLGEDLRAGLARLDEMPPGPLRARMHTAVTRAACRVLRQSDVEADLEIARQTCRAFALERYRKRVARTAEALERAGATIPAEAIEAAAAELAEPAAAQRIAEAEAGRLREPKAAAA